MKYIVYRKQVCEVVKEENGLYELVPIRDKSIKYKIPTKSNLLREVISKGEVDDLIKRIPDIEVVDNTDRLIEQVYKELMSSGTHEDLVKIIKTTYMRNQVRISNNKKTSDRDNEYFERAENYLYDELSIALGLSYEDTKLYVMKKISK